MLLRRETEYRAHAQCVPGPLSAFCEGPGYEAPYTSVTRAFLLARALSVRALTARPGIVRRVCTLVLFQWSHKTSQKALPVRACSVRAIAR